LTGRVFRLEVNQWGIERNGIVERQLKGGRGITLTAR